MKKSILAAALLAVAALAQAETSPAKQELINKVLQLQQPMLDQMSRQLAEGDALRLMQNAMSVIQFKVPPEKREALAKDVQGDVKKYVDDVRPTLRDRLTKLAPGSVGTLLNERFSEDELRQLIAVLDSPVLRKFSQMGPELNKALFDKISADSKAQIEAKLHTLDATIVKRLSAVGAMGPAATPAAK
jgi:hypothetical protein